MQDWHETLPGLLDAAWDEISDFATARSGVPGLVTLATVDASGQPECRTVVLRGADRGLGTVETYSDSETPKIRDITANPKVSVLIWQPAFRIQIRLNGTADIVAGTELGQVWKDMPPHSKKNYGMTPPPGTEIAEANMYERRPNIARLAKLRITLSDIDVVHMQRGSDIRAQFSKSDDWAGKWLAP
ncbi:MAG: pyridoxamine 5'-phosphate oxidase family protein [Marinosulfonomonas sp.]